jgi:hypothetical protein
MQTEIWEAVVGVRDKAPQAPREFVELTLPLFRSLAEEVPARTIALYTFAANRLYSLHAGDDLEAWLKALLPLARTKESEFSKLSEEELAQAAEQVMSQPKARPLTASLNEVFTRLTLSGWLPAFILCLPGLLLWPELTWETLILFLTVPTFFSLAFSPLLGWWRTSLSPNSPKNFFVALLFTGAFTLFGSIAVLALAFLFDHGSFTSVMMSDGLAFFFFFPILALANSPVPFGISFLVMCAPVWVCKVLSGLQPWVVNRSSNTWRKALAYVFLIPTVGLYALCVVDGLSKMTTDKSLREAVEASRAQATESSEAVIPPAAVSAFLEGEHSRAYHQLTAKGEDLIGPSREQYFQAWLQAGREIWEQPDWRKSDSFRALVDCFPDPLQLFDRPGTDWSSAEIESRIRLIPSFDFPSTLGNLPEALLGTSAEGQAWETWHRLLIDEARYSLSEPISQKSAEFYYTFQVRPDESFWQGFANNVRVNTGWRRYQEHKTLFLSPEPLSCEDYEKLEARENMEGPLETKFLRDFKCAKLLVTILIVEIRMAKLGGSSPPKSLDGFSDEVVELIGPYKEWLEYQNSGDQIVIGLRDCPYLPEYYRGLLEYSIPSLEP